MLNDPKLPEIVFHIEYFWRVILSLHFISRVKKNVLCMTWLLSAERRHTHKIQTHIFWEAIKTTNNQVFAIATFVRHLHFDSRFTGSADPAEFLFLVVFFDGLIWHSTSWMCHFFRMGGHFFSFPHANFRLHVTTKLTNIILWHIRILDFALRFTC